MFYLLWIVIIPLPQKKKETAKDTLTKVTELIASTGSACGKVALFLPLLAKVFQ